MNTLTQPQFEDAVSFVIARMFHTKSASEFVFYGDKRKFNEQMREYEAGARCFMLKSPAELLPRFPIAEARVVKRSLLSRLKGAFA